MRLNKSESYAIVAVLSGAHSAESVQQKISTVTLRTVQRSLHSLVQKGLITKSGPNKAPMYRPYYPSVLVGDIQEVRILDERRSETGFHFEFLDWLEGSEADVEVLPHADITNMASMSRKDLQHLTVELSWKSSSLEGNTYTLLDTELLLNENVRAKGKTAFETQMVLNHKAAIDFILKNKDLFSGTITFPAVEQLHRMIGQNLDFDLGVRKRLVRITSSQYIPMRDPHKIRETFDRILSVISAQPNPYSRALLAMSLVPYLQGFEDGNKRTGRLLANAILISTLGRGFSLRGVEARELAIAYISFYEFNSLHRLNAILQRELAS